MHRGCGSWPVRALLMIVIIGIVFAFGVATGELKSAVRSMHGYGIGRGWERYDRIPMMYGYPAGAVQYPDEVLYQ